MNERFIACGAHKNGYGAWGGGATQAEALKNFHKAGGKKGTHTVYRFTSVLPFAPFDRPATESEADAYMNNDGMWWTRCEREQVAV